MLRAMSMGNTRLLGFSWESWARWFWEGAAPIYKKMVPHFWIQKPLYLGSRALRRDAENWHPLRVMTLVKERSVTAVTLGRRDDLIVVETGWMEFGIIWPKFGAGLHKNMCIPAKRAFSNLNHFRCNYWPIAKRLWHHLSLWVDIWRSAVI